MQKADALLTKVCILHDCKYKVTCFMCTLIPQSYSSGEIKDALRVDTDAQGPSEHVANENGMYAYA